MNNAVKYDTNKVCYSDIPQLTLKSVAKVFNYGTNKYSKFNYNKGMNWFRYYDACQRHLLDWTTCKDIDESTHHHIDHAIASLMMLRENIHLKLGKDDRNSIYKIMEDGYIHSINDAPPNVVYDYVEDGITKGELSVLIQAFPNDQSLGEEIRRIAQAKNIKGSNNTNKVIIESKELDKEMD